MSSPIELGALLAGKYRVERVLGEGGMGVVVAARHVQLGELVAIKFLLREMTADPEIVQRFSREARAAVRIKSEHVAHVSDVGTLESGAPYMVMEYLHGSDLGAVLAKQGALPIDEAVDFVAQACEAIAEAHALGIVHRDLKPSNLMLVVRNDGTACIKVLDFGISKVAASADGSDLVRTKTSMALGSPLYMSPEQMVSARDVDGRTDIWALGAILYELIGGAPPFIAESFGALVLEVTQAPLKPLRQVRREVSPGLEAVVARCLTKDRADRYATVADFAQALAPFAPERAILPIERALRILRGSGSSNTTIEETLAQSVRRSSSAAREAPPPSGAAGDAQRAPHFPTSVNWAHTAQSGTKRRTATLVLLGAFAVAGIAAATFFRDRDAGTLQHSFAPTSASPGASSPAAVQTVEHEASHTPPPAATSQVAAERDERAAASASAPSITPAPSQSAAADGTAALAPHLAPRPGRPGRGSKVHAVAASPAAPTPAAPAPVAAPPAPAPAPQPTAPKGSAYDDM
jgi:eukaryotic-like serine/threonine-protein kinase